MSKSAGAFFIFILLLCLPVFIPQPIHAEANGFVFSKEGGKEYMYRFSFNDPGVLSDRKEMDESFPIAGNYLTFANRPWMFCFSWWRGESTHFCHIDTASAKQRIIDMKYLINNFRRLGLSYDARTNSLYFLLYTNYSGITPMENYLYRISLSFRGEDGKQILQFNDTSQFVTFNVGADGFGYAINSRGQLKKLNLTTGSSKPVGRVKTGGKITHSDFNPVNGKLYLLVNPGKGYTELVEMDIKTAKSKTVAKWEGDYSSLAISGNVYPPPLEAPSLISPLGHIDNLEPMLEWTPVEGAAGYFINHREMYDGVGHPWWKWNDVKESRYRVKKGEFASSFNNYWWVAAYDSSGLGYFSGTAVVNDRGDEK